MTGEVVPGSWAWSPAGDRAAFLAGEYGRAARVLVVLMPAATSETDQLRNLADIASGDSRRLPTSPLVWTPDGRAVLIPLPAMPAGGLFSLAGGSRAGYAVSEPGPRPPVPLPGVAGMAPGWRDGRTLVTLQPNRDGQLTVLQVALDTARLLANGRTPAGTPAPTGDAASRAVPRSTLLATVALRLSSTVVGARWDGANRQALVAIPSRAGGQDDLAWWWVQW